MKYGRPRLWATEVQYPRMKLEIPVHHYAMFTYVDPVSIWISALRCSHHLHPVSQTPEFLLKNKVRYTLAGLGLVRGAGRASGWVEGRTRAQLIRIHSSMHVDTAGSRMVEGSKCCGFLTPRA